MQAVLEVKNLRAGYADREILKGISFTLGADDFFAIIGPSGSGKSTLLRCVNYLEELTNYFLNGSPKKPFYLGSVPYTS